LLWRKWAWFMPFQSLISSPEPGPRPTTSNHKTGTVFDSGLAQLVQALHFREGCKNDLIHHKFASTQLHKKYKNNWSSSSWPQTSWCSHWLQVEPQSASGIHLKYHLWFSYIVVQ
jgi:hypothetical protein